VSDHKQVTLGPKWRHLCLKATDIEVTMEQTDISVTVELARELMFQGTSHIDAKVMISDRFQGAYVCAPDVVVAPKSGTLQFIGDGWVYTPNSLPLVEDDFQYVLRANGLESNAATVTITKA
jgi:hypothetical protein